MLSRICDPSNLVEIIRLFHVGMSAEICFHVSNVVKQVNVLAAVLFSILFSLMLKSFFQTESVK